MGNCINIKFTKELDGQQKLHLFRYFLGRGFITPQDIVLDLGCGSGYGTEIIADVAKSVIGIDIDEPEVLGALKNKKDNVEYYVKNLEEWNIPKADVSVQFENLEHLYNPERFAKKLKESIKKFIILSVPMGCEKLIDVNGDIQADLDSTHHAVFDNPFEVDRLFVDDNWRQFFSFKLGVTYISIYYNSDNYEI
ncbi:class I SAM-dependent methyltransferase [Candidatus Dojkabacteria bacterium]|nr:class I SAM-dependent methyltransferase [Candidatus Dojkabacteria bacterium]